MILTSHTPHTSLPPAKRSWKTTTVDDVVALIKLAEGRDPAWKFLEIRQLDEIQRNVARVVSAPDREAALNHTQSPFTSIREAIETSASRGAPLLASELCVAQTARERLERWESGRTKTFEEVPVGLRVLLNVRNRLEQRRLLDTPNSACAQQFTDCIRISTSKGWMVDDKSGVPKISDKATAGVMGAFRASMVRPTGTEALAHVFNLPPTDFAGIGAEILKLAQEDLSHAFGKPRNASVTTNQPSGVSTKAPIIEHALEVLQHRSGVRPTRPQIIQATMVALNALEDPSVRDADLPVALTREVATLCFPPDATDSQVRTAACYLTALTPMLRNLSRGFEGMLQSMQSYADRSVATTDGRAHRFPSLQREAIALAGHWLTRKDLPSEIRAPLKRVLLKGASPYAPRASAEVAMHWVTRNQESFSERELERATLSILEHHDRAYLYHSLYISAESARREEGAERQGALETIRDLVRAGRLGIETASQAYRLAGLYIIRRERDPRDGLWITQRAETTSLMNELNALSGVDLKARWEAELEDLEDSRRTNRNEEARNARHRKERMLYLAGDYIKRQAKT